MTTESKPFLGRCKSCDYAVFATEDDLQIAETLNDVLPGGAYRRRGARTGLARCPERHRVFTLKQIEGTYSEDFKCDSRCLNAKGRKCTCSCGGLNHGRGHAVQLQPLQAYRQAVAKDPAVFGGRDVDEEVIDPLGERMRQSREIDQKEQDETSELPRIVDEILLGEEGGKIEGWCRCIHKQEVNDAILYVFLKLSLPGEAHQRAKIKWFKPSWVNDEYEIGDEIKFRAKVKRHEDNAYGKATLVTYFEEI